MIFPGIWQRLVRGEISRNFNKLSCCTAVSPTGLGELSIEESVPQHLGSFAKITGRAVGPQHYETGPRRRLPNTRGARTPKSLNLRAKATRRYGGIPDLRRTLALNQNRPLLPDRFSRKRVYTRVKIGGKSLPEIGQFLMQMNNEEHRSHLTFLSKRELRS